MLFKLQLGDHGHISDLAQPRCIVDHLGGECDVAAPHAAYDHLGKADLSSLKSRQCDWLIFDDDDKAHEFINPNHITFFEKMFEIGDFN